MTSLMWFRRDLRLRDHPALRAAAAHGPVLGLFVLDPVLWRGAGPARRAWLAATLRSLDESMGGRLCIRMGDPASLVPSLAREVGADEVHVTNDHSPYGRRRDQAVVDALPEGVRGVATGTPYAVAPGTVKNGSGSPYKVFTPFSRAWRDVGWEEPQQAPRGVEWVEHDSDGRVAAMLDKALDEAPASMPTAGEDAAKRRFEDFLDADVADYDDVRDDPGADRTSRLSAYLKYGVVHPRQLLARTRDHSGSGAATFETELCWRDFYADVLHHHPRSAWHDLRPVKGLTYDDPGDAVDAWKQGTTGFPIVDAGMRQLLHEGWMHNRVRMITASFLTKDLHVWWPVGARHFLDHLVDGDLASNNHGWQWVAGTGTDASPYFRVFNPITQGQKFDPSGDYVRRWVPELRHLEGKHAHAPWDAEGGYDHDYPQRIVDHAAEREVALERYGRGRD
ncbi:deoxyribodipyrimidine photo-lyase [Nocardioides scoriae]|uniref:Deoxyribodipyrimidine photo-lyase n=1 Tax=Nocardioides scoriae TaxID=642780 RepID=A0A1H1W5U5_9ACTN|nr:deoxyribodipyrimidine photo-lyase [Nocardioides scoriae]SDS92021.1 deoxyribodipyrimidine photo-lyase [Nocardioides scoriae]